MYSAIVIVVGIINKIIGWGKPNSHLCSPRIKVKCRLSDWVA